jgi:two-component system cell cycle response regulator
MTRKVTKKLDRLAQAQNELRALQIAHLELTKTLEKNEGVLSRVLNHGFAILERPSLSELLRFLTTEFPHLYRVQKVALRIIDTEHEIENLLRAEGSSPSEFTNLFVNTEVQIGYRWPERPDEATPAPEAALVTPSWIAGAGLWRTVLEPYSASRHQGLFPEASGLGSVAVMPLLLGSKPLGLFAVASHDRLRYTADLGTAFLQLLAGLTGIAIQNQINAARLRLTGLVDPLTELFNRRYLDAQLREEIRKAIEENASIACLVVDVDHFKRVNDTYGHDGGDAVLKEMAARLRSSVKTRDVVSRIGGEEFVVVASHLEKEAAAALAERIRRAVHDRPISARQTEFTVSVSIGICWCQARNLIVRGIGCGPLLLTQADEALYRAKNEGRNCARLSESPI